MHGHQDYLINIPLTIGLALISLWIEYIDQIFGAWTHFIIPAISTIYLTLQIIIAWRKLHSPNEEK